MRHNISIAFTLFSLLFTSCIKSGSVRRIDFERQSIATSGFSEVQLARIEASFKQLKSLKAGPLKIKKSAYRRLSRFESLFGFPFNGPMLLNWVLRRMPKIAYQNTWTVAINQNKGTLFLGDRFFKELTDMERLYLWVHEARHSDDDGHEHVRCPEGFRFISAGQPEQDLEGEKACDEKDQGAYAFQAAFLYELFAYGIFDQREVGGAYNSSISRVLK